MAKKTAPLLPATDDLLRLFGDTRGHALGFRLVGPVAGLIVFGGFVLFGRYNAPDEVANRVEPEAVFGLEDLAIGTADV